jgi:prepilin-type N-terminal cleavage/methylation domain-containing protein
MAQRWRRRGQRGFTLIELMIAMLIAGILIAMIFAVYTRMTVAYQAQTRIADIHQNLRSGLDQIVRELRLAGSEIPSADYLRVADNGVGDPEPQPIGASYPPTEPPPPTGSTAGTVLNGGLWNGIKISDAQTIAGQGAGQPIRPLYVVNGGGREPDEISFFYADKSKRAAVQSITFGNPILVTLAPDPNAPGSNAAAQFIQDELVLLVNTQQVRVTRDLDGDLNPETYERTEYETCLLVNKSGGTPPPNELHFARGTGNPFNKTNSPVHHCQAVIDRHTADVSRPVSRSDTMIYRFAARSYRIDPSRRELGVLQWRHEDLMAIFTPWKDLGVGFTNLQIATQWLEPWDLTDADADVDPDNDPTLDWYSGENQETPQALAMPVRATITVETRSLDRAEGIPTASLPDLRNTSAPDNNSIGDAPAITLPVAGDPRYDGEYIFRWTSLSIDLRNAGVGR